MEIRMMTAEDIPQIAQLEKDCFADPWSVASFTSELNNPLSTWLVAVDGEVVAGYIGAQTVLDSADIMNVAVLPNYRRTGIGERLIHSLCAQLSQRGAQSVLLEVRVSNTPAIKLYEKLGFTVVGRRPNYYFHPKEDALIYRKEGV